MKPRTWEQPARVDQRLNQAVSITGDRLAYLATLVACTFEIRIFRFCLVSATATDEAAVDMRDHCLEMIAFNALWTSNVCHGTNSRVQQLSL